MKVTRTKIPDLWVIKPGVFSDQRGFFLESFGHRKFAEQVGQDIDCVKDNPSRSAKNALRNLHDLTQRSQGELVRVTERAVFDVTVDLRLGSPTLGQHVLLEVSALYMRLMWVHEEFVHGCFLTSSAAEGLYKTTDYWAEELDRNLAWNDPSLKIKWPIQEPPILFVKDQNSKLFADAYPFE
jgi:dTDP-4-dehydrorhamnose 3,5-epimerase